MKCAKCSTDANVKEYSFGYGKLGKEGELTYYPPRGLAEQLLLPHCKVEVIGSETVPICEKCAFFAAPAFKIMKWGGLLIAVMTAATVLFSIASFGSEAIQRISRGWEYDWGSELSVMLCFTVPLLPFGIGGFLAYKYFPTQTMKESAGSATAIHLRGQSIMEKTGANIVWVPSQAKADTLASKSFWTNFNEYGKAQTLADVLRRL